MSQLRRQFIKGGALTLGSALLSGCYTQSLRSGGDIWNRAKQIDQSVQPVAIPAKVFHLSDYLQQNTTNHTEAFTHVVAACRRAGGGKIVVPPGTYFTGPIELSSNINLHVERGAHIKFSTNPEDYPLVLTRYEGVELYNFSSLIYARNANNVMVSGEGILDGQAANDNWWSWCGAERFGWKPGMPQQTPDRNELFAQAEQGVPVKERVFGAGHYLRPSFIVFYNCENVEVNGITLRDSPFWNVHPILCRNVRVTGVTVTGHGPNNDGCNPESVDGMVIEKCFFNTGDDCIAIKSGRNADGRRVDRPSQNIVIRGCQMRDGHGGVVIGSEVSGHVKHVYVEDCVMDSPELWYALRIKNNAVRGGKIEHVYVRDISVGKVKFAAITCDFNYEEGSNGRYTPEVNNVQITRMDVANAVRVIDSQGLPNALIHNISIKDSSFSGVSAPSIVTFTTGLALQNVRVNGQRVDTVGALTAHSGDKP